MTLRLAPALTFAALVASPAFAASDAHGGGGFIGGFMYSLTDPVTHTAFLAFAAFLLIAWRMGALKTILGGLDKRADDIRNELEAAQSLREQATRLAGAVQVFKLSRGDGAATQGGLGYAPRTTLAAPMAQTGDGEGQHAPGSGARAPAQLQ